jgi:hypothetical protein
MAILTWKHRTTKQAAKSAVQDELTRLGYGSGVDWNGFEATARVCFGRVLNAKGTITDTEIIVEKCDGFLKDKVLRECHELLEKLFPGGNVPTSVSTGEQQDGAKEQGYAKESIGSEGFTVDELVWKFSVDQWEEIAHLNDGQLIEYLFRISNTAYNHTIKQIPESRFKVLPAHLDALIARAEKASWLHQRINHTNSEREQLIRGAVAEQGRPGHAEETMGPEGLTVDQLVWKFSVDQWEHIAHLDDGELIEYLFRISNTAYDRIIKLIPGSRCSQLSAHLDDLIAHAKKPSWFHQRINHTNSQRERLIRGAIDERERSRITSNVG